MNLTEEEYLNEQPKNAYDIFQRSELNEYVESLDEYKSYEEYEKHLINSAEIIFPDPKIEKLCR